MKSICHQLIKLDTLVVIIILFILISTWTGLKLYQKRRRKLLLSKAFPDEWRTILEGYSSLYRSLPSALKTELHGLIHIFLDEKRFEGCQGLKVTDEMKLLIASQACLLLLNKKTGLYPTLSTILVYPSTYLAPEKVFLGFNQMIETKQARLGESWKRGSVVLVWDRVLEDSKDQSDGQNVVIHEFAHQLDQEDSSSDGVPILKTRGHYVTWARVFGREYKKLQDDLARNYPTLLRDYAATNAAEFFAVATEVFFENPHVMKDLHPELYQELCGYYCLDPAEWTISLPLNS